MNQIKNFQRLRRKKRIQAKISRSIKRPRLVVFKSNAHLYAQIINDVLGETLIAASDVEIKKSIKDKKTKTEMALAVGKKLAEKAIAQNIKKVVFDRNGFKFHGRIKALAEGAKSAGLIF